MNQKLYLIFQNDKYVNISSVINQPHIFYTYRFPVTTLYKETRNSHRDVESHWYTRRRWVNCFPGKGRMAGCMWATAETGHVNGQGWLVQVQLRL